MRSLLVLGFLLLASMAASAQTSSKSVVSVEAAGPTAPSPAGGPFQATISLTIKSGYHVNAQKPTEDYLIGTQLEATPPAGLTISKTSYPSAKMEQFSFSDVPLAVYEGVAVITITGKIAASTAPGTTTIPAKVKFQACNDSQCLPPSTVDVVIPLDIVEGTASAMGFTLTGAPPNAQVFVDGKSVGKASALGRFENKDLKPGRYRVRVELDGFEPWEQSVTVGADKAAIVPVAAVATSAAPPPTTAPAAEAPAPAPPPPSEPAATPASAAPSSRLPIYLVGGVVAVALAALGFVAMNRSKRAD